MPKTEARFVDFRAVKLAVTMEQVLAHYGILDRFKRGQDSLSGPCPIHQGTNPTQFRVSLSKNCWNCFSECHCGGNVLDFVAKMENIEPIKAANCMVKWFRLDLAQLKADMPESKSTRTVSASNKGECKRKAYLRTEQVPIPEESPSKPTENVEAVVNKPLGFKLELDVSHPYLAERGLSRETVAEFEIGYCAKGIMAQRIAIPIHTVKGELVGYAGRWPGEPPDGRPKYRLPDGFKKSFELFNFSRALQEPDEQPLVLVEGVFDVMKLWQFGVRKVVALMGSTMSDAQQALIAKHTHCPIIVMFDEDDAGRYSRVDVVCRLVAKSFVRMIVFSKEGFQPEQLTAKEISLLQLGSLP